MLFRWFITGNVMANPRMSMVHVKSDYRKVLNAGAVGGLQECQYEDYYEWAQDVGDMLVVRREVFGGYEQGGVPMFYKPSFARLEGRGSHLLHEGEDEVTPFKKIKFGIMSLKMNKDCKFIMTNRHYVAKAFNGKIDSKEKIRRKLWEIGNANDKEFLALLSDGYGYPIVNFGDYNNNARRVYGVAVNGHRVHYFQHGYDKVSFIDGDEYVWDFGKNPKTKRFSLFSDHDGFGVRARLIRRPVGRK